MRKTLKKLKQKAKGKLTGLTRRRLSEEDKRRLYLNNSSESNVSSFSPVESINSNNSSVESTESNFFGLPPGYGNYNSKNNESNMNNPFQRVPGKIVPLKLKSNSPNINLAEFDTFRNIPTVSARRTIKSKSKSKSKSPQKSPKKTRRSGKRLRGKPKKGLPKKPDTSIKSKK